MSPNLNVAFLYCRIGLNLWWLNKSISLNSILVLAAEAINRFAQLRSAADPRSNGRGEEILTLQARRNRHVILVCQGCRPERISTASSLRGRFLKKGLIPAYSSGNIFASGISPCDGLLCDTIANQPP